MYRVLIADDEQVALEGIRDFIPWKELGVDSVLLASDGLEALELAKKNKPNLIISDIKMPNLNGINFVEKLRTFLPFCQIIFMSAYSDKEYLKSAIRLKAVHYLEKPIDVNEMTSAIREAFKAIMLESNHLNNPIHLQQIALSLTENNAKEKDRLTEKLERYCPEFLHQSEYFSLILLINDTCSMEYSNEIYELFLQKLHQKFSYILFTSQSHNNIFQIGGIECCDNRWTCEIMQQIISSIHQEFDSNEICTVSIGKKVNNTFLLYDSYADAQHCLSKIFFTGYGSVICNNSEIYLKYIFEERDFSKFCSTLQSDTRDNVLFHLECMKNHIQKCTGTDIDYIKNSLYRYDMEITSAFLQRLTDNETRKTVSDKLTSETLLKEYKTLYGIFNYLSKKINYFYDYIEMYKQNRHVYAIKRYIEKNYASPSLTINSIAENIHLTQAHICHIFKTEMGTTVNHYIMDYRINVAKGLLLKRDCKLFEIAEKCGFSDANYFTRIFKKSTGITPSKYREEYLL